VVGILFFAKASNLNALGPIHFSFDSTNTDANNALNVAVASGFNSYVADKLTLIGEVLMGIGALTWIWTPNRLISREQK
jgi:hypothetical protein